MCFIVPVQNRNAETMVGITFDNVHKGTLIITDMWRAHVEALTKLPEYEHQTVNHSKNFVIPLDESIHTQNIEGLWSRSKYFFTMVTWYVDGEIVRQVDSFFMGLQH